MPIIAHLVALTMYAYGLDLPDSRTIELDWPCDSKSIITVEYNVYAACGADGVVVIGVMNEPHFWARLTFPGSVTGLHQHDGRIWAETTRVEAHPLPQTLPELRRQATSTMLGGREMPPPAEALPQSQWRPTNRMFEPRRGGIASAAVNVRPFLPLGTVGAGLIATVAADYHFEKPIQIGVIAEPLAGALTNDRSTGNVGATAFVAYDHELFAVGLGAGVTGLREVIYRNDGRLASQNTAFLIAQVARVGTLDGMNLSVRNSFAVINEEFQHNGTVGRGQLPLTEGAALFASGGVAQGFAFGELGVRLRMHGNGGSDTLFLEASAGGGNVKALVTADCGDGSRCRSTENYGGPLVGFGVEYRI